LFAVATERNFGSKIEKTTIRRIITPTSTVLWLFPSVASRAKSGFCDPPLVAV
jgi:hypothetical protein